MQIVKNNNFFSPVKTQGYLHTAKRFDALGTDVEFTDEETQKKVQLHLAKDIYEKLDRKFPNGFIKENNSLIAKGSMEDYLQKIWLYNKNDHGSVDANFDGYLDIEELSNSKTMIIADISDEDQIISIKRFSHKELFGDDAKKILQYKLNKMGIFEDKIPLDLDVNASIYEDKNFDGKVSDSEIITVIQNDLDFKKNIDDFIKKMIELLAEEEKRKVLNGISGGAFSASMNMKEQKDILNTLLENNGNLDALSDQQKSIFTSKDDKNSIDMKELIQRKEKLEISQNYTETQIQGAKIFSTKA
jgi:hypothetical protein